MLRKLRIAYVLLGKNQPETVQALQSAASKLGEKSSIGIEDFPGFFCQPLRQSK